MTRRRTFLALLGAVTAASAVDAGATDEPSVAQEGTSGLASADVESEDLEPAEALLAYVVALYGDRLDEEDREVILQGIEGSLASRDAFREVGLENADEPAYGFSPYRGDWS